MLYALIAIILLLSISIVVICIRARNSQLSHTRKITELQMLVVALLDSQQQQLEQQKLSDELTGKLNEARARIDSGIFDVQLDFLQVLADNKLIK